MRALFLEQRLGICSALDHVLDGFRQQIGVEARFKEIVLGPSLHREFPGLFVPRINEDQYRDLGRRAKQTFEGGYSAAVGQVEIGQYRRGAGNAFEALRAAPDPIDLEGDIVGLTQSLEDGLGRPRIVLNQQYPLSHGSLIARKFHMRSTPPSTAAGVCTSAHIP